jgi:hypothetical protein
VPRGTRTPSASGIQKALAVLAQSIPNDEPPTMFWRESESGTPHLRYSAVTSGTPWTMDIYYGNFYRAEVGAFGEAFKSIYTATMYVQQHIAIQQ